MPYLAVMAAILMIGNGAMLYSRAPHDMPAMVAHLSKVCAYLVLLLALMRQGSRDTLALIRTERALSTLNEDLEARVADRTARLEAANQTLESEIVVRQHAEGQIEAQLERLNLLHQITRAIGERQDLASIFQVAIRRVEGELPADFCCFCRYDAADSALIVAGVGIKNAPLTASLGIPGRVMIEIDANGLLPCIQGKLVYEPELTALDFPFPQQLAGAGLGSVVLAPLQVESSIFAVLITGRIAPNGFSIGDCEFLRQLSEHVALAAHQAELNNALQQAYDDLRQTQQVVMQQERLKALGEMASGIAHDINNALTPALLFIGSLLEDTALGEDIHEALTIVQRAVEDVAHTVARMREFHREHEVQTDLLPVKLDEMIRQVVDLTRPRWSDMPRQHGIVIDVVLVLAPDLPLVMGVDSEIREALINLLLNAIDAVSQGGRIEIRTAASAYQVRVEIADDGVGMDEETRRRCLEPFFTTKGERGTGLGLAMVYGIVRRHGAEIELDSEPGRGTTMRLLFPITDPARSPESVPVSLQRPSRSLLLLIVDDDPVLLKSLQRILQTDGHRVEAVDGGQAGIEAFCAAIRRGENYDAVITDLGMPHVDGSKVATAVKTESPATPVILLTGWGQRLIAENDIPPHVDRVLNKPPKLHDLRLALAEVCESREIRSVS